MKIGIIGSGHIGGTAARLFVQAGHQVALSNSRGPASLTAQVQQLGPNARAATVEEASDFGEVVLVAIPFGGYTTLPASHLSGKVVVDAMNYYPQRDGQIDFAGTNSSELVAHQLPGARLVKAFNTMYFETLGSEGKPNAPVEDRLVLFVAGDDPQAKAVVSRLIEEIGFAPADTGTLAEGGRKQQPGSPIYNHPMTAGEAQRALSTRS
ncbi:MAG TPA: NAD(P)-binding domain-containing protein [Chloroflexota bacterium]|nr:NAD(P)-binding domain-containing protein [Chloroflexota bacterium]